MQEKIHHNPSLEISLDDPGDKILERFRFQITFSGILALRMAEEDDDIEEIYCELHEDILVKHKDGKFTGVQVKTKDINLPPFNIEDDSIKKALIKFAKLEARYKDHFKHYSIVSNTGFDKSRPAKCIKTLIRNITDGKIYPKTKSKFWTLIRNISKEADCTEEQVIKMIAKLRPSTFAKLEDIHFKLINQLKLCSLLKGVQESKIEEIADLLIAKHLRASSLSHKEESASCFIMGIQSEIDDIKRILDGKRITSNDISLWLNKQKNLPVALLLKDRNKIDNIPKGHRRLEIKMDAGGIDSENIDLLRNFKFAFENHAITWMHKDGLENAENKYNQVSYIIQNTCKEIFDSTNVIENENGQKMLIEVRNNLRLRKNIEPDLFFDCSYEHLLGAVGILTESCKVWWSKPFEID